MEDYIYADMSERGHVLAGDGAAVIKTTVEDCLRWVRWQTSKYHNHTAIALDFGKRGTSKFFPLSLLSCMLEVDERLRHS